MNVLVSFLLGKHECVFASPQSFYAIPFRVTDHMIIHGCILSVPTLVSMGHYCSYIQYGRDDEIVEFYAHLTCHESSFQVFLSAACIIACLSLTALRCLI